jgi:peptidoglycan/LPS O-acetylase OafA/YrhL
MRFNNIQLLRLVAALGVVLGHAGYYSHHWLGTRPGGGLVSPRLQAYLHGSVPLFFAVSGFVLAHARQSTPAGRFFLARFLRLYPGYWLAVGLTAALMLHTNWPDFFRSFVTWNWRWAALAPVGPGACPYVLGIEWSLIYEVALSVGIGVLGLFGPRRGLPVMAALWLAAIVTKVVVRPGYAFDMLPHWDTILISPWCTPFVLGILVYYLRDHGHRARWVVNAALILFVAEVPTRLTLAEHACVAWGVASAATVWLVVQLPQVSAGNRLARLGDYTYGLYLIHVPLLYTTIFLFKSQGWFAGRTNGTLALFAIAVAGGLLFGRLEAAVYKTLRPLAGVRLGALRRRLAGLTAPLRLRPSLARTARA